MKLSVPILGQRDPRWSQQRLGTVNGTTIGGYGCLITCVTMVLQYFNKNIQPNQLDDWLTNNNGYADGNLLKPESIHGLYSDVTLTNNIFCSDVPAPLGLINQTLESGMPVIIQVDFDHDSKDGIQTHFVVIVGVMNDGTYIINDPWFGDQVFLTGRYAMGGVTQAQAIDQVVTYSGPIFQAPTAIPSPVLTPSNHTPSVPEIVPSASQSASISPSISSSASASPSEEADIPVNPPVKNVESKDSGITSSPEGQVVQPATLLRVLTQLINWIISKLTGK